MHRYLRRFGFAGRSFVRLSVIALVSLGLIVPASAQATVVTIGSPLTASFSPAQISGTGSATLINSALGETGANVKSPVSGMIIRWRITLATGGPFTLRVLTPVSGTTYTGGAASTPQTPAGTSTQTFTTNLPIQAGQVIGLDPTASTDQIGAASVPNSNDLYWQPALGNGETRAGTGSNTFELGFNVDVATIPSNADTLGSVKRNTHKGTATLTVNVPGPGTISLTGKGVKTQRPAREATASKTVTAARTVKLLVKPKGKAKKKLKKTGKAKVKVSVTYTPTGDAAGVPNAQTKTVKLVKK